jgi:hypothetical protein
MAVRLSPEGNVVVQLTHCVRKFSALIAAVSMPSLVSSAAIDE